MFIVLFTEQTYNHAWYVYSKRCVRLGMYIQRDVFVFNSWNTKEYYISPVRVHRLHPYRQCSVNTKVGLQGWELTMTFCCSFLRKPFSVIAQCRYILSVLVPVYFLCQPRLGDKLRGRSRGGGTPEGQNPPPFWGTPKLHKEGKKTSRM